MYWEIDKEFLKLNSKNEEVLKWGKDLYQGRYTDDKYALKRCSK